MKDLGQKMRVRKATVAALLVFAGAAMAEDSERAAAVAAFERHDGHAALSLFDALRQKFPGDAEILFYLGRSQVLVHRAKSAVENLQHAVELAPQKSDYHLYLAEALGAYLDEAGVLKKVSLSSDIHRELEQAVALDPHSADAHEGLMTYYLQAPALFGGDLDKARAESAAIMNIDPARGYETQALILQHEEKTAEAIASFQKAIALAPKTMSMRFELGTLYDEQQRYAESRAVWQDMIKADPKYAAAYYRAGRTAVLSGEHLQEGEQALKTYLQFPASDPSPAAAHWRLGNLYEKMQRKEQARAEYQASLSADPEFAEAKKSLNGLD